jgi:hypothetical protein
MNEAFKLLEEYFREFITDKEVKDELEFCLTQSQVEQFVRSKFAYWVHKEKLKNSFSLIETNRIDLVIQIEGYKYCLEFGHQVNLLKHKPSGHKEKIEEDVANLPGKLKSLSNKIDGFSRENNVCCCTISLFTDFHLVKNKKKLEVKYVLDRLGYMSGVFAKYGTTVSDKSGDYFHEYKKELESYNSYVIIDDVLTFHWKIQEW